MEQEIDTNALGEAIVKTLKTIYDPEIPVDIYELGLIYDVMVNTDYEVKILMTLTSKLSCSRKFTKRSRRQSKVYQKC
jgi:metal-sulfur cluster biosynthetic enzyme